MNPAREQMPALFAHRGVWDGSYRHIATDGTLIDEHRTLTRCEFPEHGQFVYIQHNLLIWPDGREAHYRFGGTYREGRLYWDTDRFHGFGWETDCGILMLELQRRDETDARYVEMITLADDGRSRARTWQWFEGGRPTRRTLCDEVRVSASDAAGQPGLP